MAIEYKLSFDKKEEALAFQKFLKTLSVASKIETEWVDSYDEYYSGTVRAFTSFIAEKREALSKIDEKLREDVKGMLESMEKQIEQNKKHVADLYAEYPVGVSFSLHQVDIDNLNSLDMQDLHNAFSPIFQKNLFTKHHTLELLMRNGTVAYDEKTKKWTILENMNIDELVVNVRDVELNLPEPINLDYYELSVSLTHYAHNSYIVAASPAIYLNNIIMIKEFLSEEAGLLPEECEEEYNKLSYKRFEIIRLMNLILDGYSSVEKLQRQISEPGRFSSSNPHVFFRADISIQYLNDVLADLRKIGLISIKNGVLKVDKSYVRLGA